jgi:urease accessory protein
MSTSALLLGLQLGDSFFPSGATAHSFGLEGLQRTAAVTCATDVESFVSGQLAERWATSDRSLLLHAHAAADDLTRIAALDAFCDCSTFVESWRSAGRRLGRAQLTLHAQLGTPLTAAYRELVETGVAPGQGCVVQGLIGFALGLAAQHTAALSAHALAVSMVGAALRLGVIGHVDAQRILLRQLPRTAALIDLPLTPVEEVSAWVPAAEIASMTQEAQRGRLFAT